MNANQLINMVMRLFLRKFITKGIDKGFDMASRRRGSGDPADAEADGRQKAQGQDMAKRARQAMRVGRRVGRF